MLDKAGPGEVSFYCSFFFFEVSVRITIAADALRLLGILLSWNRFKFWFGQDDEAEARRDFRNAPALVMMCSALRHSRANNAKEVSKSPAVRCDWKRVSKLACRTFLEMN